MRFPFRLSFLRRERRLRSLRAAFGGCSPHAPEGAVIRAFGPPGGELPRRGKRGHPGVSPWGRALGGVRAAPIYRVGATLAVVPGPTMHGVGQDGPPSAVGTPGTAFPTGRCCRQGRKHGQVAIGTDFVGFAEKPVAHWFFKIFQKCEFSNTGKLAIYIDIKVFFKQKLYKVSGFQWTNREFCCIIITFLCRRRKR